jgi:hypothetical protein
MRTVCQIKHFGVSSYVYAKFVVMAKARKWEQLDEQVAELFSILRDRAEPMPSFRMIGDQTGMSHTRVADIFKRTGGVPTLHEFVSLCVFFGLKPSLALEKMLGSGESLPQEVDYDQMVDFIVANPDVFDIAALHDEKKSIERDTPRD